MSGYPPKDFAQNLLAVISGTLITVVVLYSLLGFLLFTDVYKIDDKPEEGESALSAYVSLALAIALAAATGAYITAKLSTRNDWLHVTVAAVATIAFALFTNELELGLSTSMNYLYIGLILPAAFVGGWLGMRKKRIA